MCSGMYDNNVRFINTSTPSLIIDCIDFMWGKQTDKIVSYMHIN